MAKKRIISTAFWEDDKVVDEFSPEDKYFMLYLLTNPHSTQLGIYQIPKKTIAFEMGYSKEAVDVLMDRFENKYQVLKYNKETKEIAIKNYLVHSIIKGGKPVEDLLLKELREVKDDSLINYVFNNIYNKLNLNETVFKIINIYKNENVNDNDNVVSYHDSYNDSFEEEKPIVKLPLIDKTEFDITQSMIDDWQKVYAAIDVKFECERMRLWLEANPLNKKTRRGIARFINTWLSRSQDRAPKVDSQNQIKEQKKAPEEGKENEADVKELIDLLNDL